MRNLIPRELLFGNPDVMQVNLSPNGQWISYIAPDEGVLNIWVAPLGKLEEAKAVTRDRKRGIRAHGWTVDSGSLCYAQDLEGDENWHIHLVPAQGGEDRDLTPFPKTSAQILKGSFDHPDKLLVGLNNRDERFHDVHLLDLPTGKLTEVFRNDKGYAEFTADFDLNVRMTGRFNPDGGFTYFAKDPSGEMKEFMTMPSDDTIGTGPVGFTKEGKILFFQDNAGRDTVALYRYDLSKGTREMVIADERADVSRVLTNHLTGELEAVAFYYERQTWKVLEPKLKPDFEFLEKQVRGDFEIMSRTKDDQKWVVVEWQDDGPSSFFLYDRPAKSLKLLMVSRKALMGKPLAKMRPVVLSSRDGFKMVSYLTLPGEIKADRPGKPLPLVLFVHGGPQARDSWGFNPYHQLLSDRGYAVLSVNYRGSTGFGKNFVNAGKLEWGRKMHEDLIDAVEWAIREKIADPRKIAIMGGSYGGYATLAGLTFTPDLFACGVDIVGPSNLNTLLSSIPPYWTAFLDSMYQGIGDPRTPEGKKLLEDRSPLNHVEKIKKPLLIAQGANDPRVKQAESDQIVKAMKEKGIPVTYVLYPDEGHGFARPQNNLAFMAVTEAFLKQHLGGEAEPVGKAFEGSSITIPEGKEGIPGL
jgi:dipeptidyl aminopeptidase/acylaminoacyl peptidase